MNATNACRLLRPDEWEQQRFQLLRFVRRHGERRITGASWRQLANTGREKLSEPGTAFAISCTPGGWPAGIAYAENFGESACLVAVHPALRGRSIGRSLLGCLAAHCGNLTCRVASDNPASLAMCFAAGFIAVGLEAGPTGKATLRFMWKPELQGSAKLTAVMPALPAGR